MAAIGNVGNPSHLIFTYAFDDNGNLRELCVHAGNINAVWSIVDAPPLHASVCCDNVEMVRILLRNGADVNLRDDTGNSPLLLNCRRRSIYSVEIFHLLLESGADVNARDSDGLTALHVVRCPWKVKELLRRGADANARDNKGRTPLDDHLLWGKINSNIRELLHWGAKIDKSSVFNLVEDKDCSMELFRIVFEGTGNTDIRGSLMRTPLHCAARVGRADLVRLLLDCGASVDARDEFGRTPLRVAASYNKCGVEVFSGLIREGADVNAKCNEGLSPLLEAYLFNYEASVGLLLSAGADPDVLWFVPPDHPCFPLVLKHSVLRNYDSKWESFSWWYKSDNVNQCLSEIGTMKRTRLSEALTLYDVAFGDKWDISCARKVYEYMSSGEYPMYSGLAMPKLALNVKKHLGDRANNNSLFMLGLSKKSSFRTNQHVLLQIVKYISDDDCLNLYIAGC